ncbi:purine catabolism regulatory protein [Brevibacterium siliguriense]|uniref:Purine catabolism regulatory protein n=1 Tax=Brevibacterium siliguriense TaxID=1136497 RepID=A0A1H1REM6_9MICO|nr:PucR family transcriptional regulator [Brevibacterium siliguriense]SDS34201.1 purine catabolism regulatory protein [Brevibacterium siliguriense]
MVTLEQIWSRTELALEVIVDSATAAEQNVTIVHSSELPEVDEWLAGGEVLLTIGVGQDLSGETVRDYVRRLKAVGVHALGIGLGSDLPWQQVPPGLVAAAEEAGLALFGVPEPVPFVAVVDAFTRMREAETNRELTRASSAARRFATALAARGPAALVTDLAETLKAPVRFVSPTGRALSGEDAEDDVRSALIEESAKPTAGPRLIRTVSRIVEAVPIGGDRPLGWILTPAEVAGSPKTRALLLSTASALLAMSLADLPVPSGRALLFEADLSEDEARGEWTRATGLAPVATVGMRIFGGVRGDLAERLISDIVGGSLHTRTGSLLGVIGARERGLDALVTTAAEVAGLDELAEKRPPLGQLHHTWMLWRTQHESEASEVRALLSAVDEEAADRFVDRVLGELFRARGGQELLETLRTYIAESGTRERIAAQLGIHRHTVRARLAKIETLLGRDLSRAETLQAVSLALELAEI